MKRLVDLLLLAAFFALGYWLAGRDAERSSQGQGVRIDTIFYPSPQPVRELPREVAAVRIPRVIFAPADSVTQTVVVDVDADSVTLQVAVEHRQYGDSTYRAQISGAAIGELRPTLDWIEVYHRTEIQTIVRPPRWEVAAMAGANLDRRWVGLSLRRNVGRLSLEAVAGFDPWRNTPHLEARAGFAVWRK